MPSGSKLVTKNQEVRTARWHHRSFRPIRSPITMRKKNTRSNDVKQYYNGTHET